MHNPTVIYKQLSELNQKTRYLSLLKADKINEVLSDIATTAIANADAIIEENAKDLQRMDPKNPKYDRLLLNKDRIKGIARDIMSLVDLPSPCHRVLEEKQLKNGLHLKKVSVPIGTIGIIFESRPNVTFDVFSICLKSGNACVLKGSRDAHYSNVAIVSLIKQVCDKHSIFPPLYLAPSERESLPAILQAIDYIDAIIPRGSQGLIDFVRDNAKVPVIETGAGIVHTYFDRAADLSKAKRIIKNAKTRRVSVCNALDTLLVHRDRLADLPAIFGGLDHEFKLQLYADEASFSHLSGYYEKKCLHKARANHFGTEFLSMKLAIKTVNNFEEAVDHIYKYSSKHSEAIITEDPNTSERFMNVVDAAVVYVNTSTAFTDGAQFGMGAEIGISTQKLHARGPMALRELTSYKWLVQSKGEVRIP